MRPFRRILLSVVLPLLLLAACARGTEHGQAGVLALSMPAGPLTLDPQRDVSGAAATVTMNLFAGLMRVDPATGAATPDLVATLPDISPDGLTYTFTLRQNLVWVNPQGEPVAPLTASDVVATFRRLCDNSTDPSLVRPFYIIKKCGDANQAVGTADLEAIAVRAVDERVVEFTLTEPAAYFALLLTHWAARPLPSQWVIQGAGWANPAHIVTSGPFRLDAFDPARGLRLLRNAHFHTADTVTLSEVNIAFASDPTAPLAAYVRNMLDIAPVPPHLVAAVRADPALKGQLREWSGLCTTYLGFTTVKAPLDSREVRLALSQAVDRAALAALMPGTTTPARFLTPPGIFGAPDGERAGVGTDTARARDLLARAGYPGGVGLPPLTLAYPDGDEHRAIAETVQGAWQETLGLAVTLVPLPQATAADALRSTVPLPQMPHVWLHRHCGSFPDAFAWLAPTFSVSKSPNIARRVATTYEALLDEAAREPNAERRRERYARAEQELVYEEAVYAPLLHEASYVVVKPWLTGEARPFGGSEYRDWRVEMAAKEAARASE